MTHLISFAVGLAFGVGYALLHVKSPAPPIFALFGLLGMQLGEQGVPWIRQHDLPGQGGPAHAAALPEPPRSQR